MATWTAPTTRSTGDLISASIWNTDLTENLKYLKDAPVFDGVVTLTAGAVGAPALTTSGDLNTGVYFPAADTLAITTGGTERVRITAAGNVGIGVTPSAWNSSYRAIQLNGGSLWALNSQNLLLTQNAYSDGTNYRYVSSATNCSNYQMTNGTHLWFTAPSGTAGDVATFTERMRLTSDGNLAIGATAKLYLDGTGATGDTYLVESAANTLDLVAGGTTFRYTTTALRPATNDAAALGVSGTAWSDLFLASGGVINWNAGDTTLTHTAANTLTVSSAATSLRYNVYSTSNSGAPKLALMNGLNSCGIGLLGDSSGTMVFFAGDATSERMRIDSAGNVGIGVTPSATQASYRSMELFGSLWMGGNGTTPASYNYTNAYYDGAEKYKTSGFAASLYRQVSGAHSWFTAPSGTAGNAVTFTERFAVLNGGNLAIGATAKFYLDGVAGTGDTYIYEQASNVIHLVAGGVAYQVTTGRFAPTTDNAVILGGSGLRWVEVWAANGTIQTSDRTLKRDISTDTLGLDFLLRLRPVSFTMHDEADGVRRHGLIAQDVMEAAQDTSLVGILTGDKDGEYGLNYAGFVPALIKAVQQQQAKIAALEARLN